MSRLTNSLGIIADDLTGACDTALQFFNAGLETAVLVEHQSWKEEKTFANWTWVINTDSRHLDSYDAVARVKKLTHFMVEKLGVDAIYKKLDSTFRGHIAQECLGVLDELRWQACLVAPAYPEQDRQTIGGYQIVAGLPLEQTDAARDPLCPVHQSYLPDILSEQSSPNIVGYLPLSLVIDGAGPIRQKLMELLAERKKLILADACSDIDLEQIALAINALPNDMRVLPCGSAGLAKAMTKKLQQRRERLQNDMFDEDMVQPQAVQLPHRPILMMIGSMSSVSRIQIETLLAHSKDYGLKGNIHHLPLTHSQIFKETPIFPLIEEAIVLLNAGQNVLLTTSYPAQVTEECQAYATQQGLSPLDMAQKINRLFSEMALQITTDCPTHLVLSGGETANAVCKAIGSQYLKLMGEVETSITLCHDQLERYIVTKSGGFGERTTLLNILKTLEEMSEP